MCDGISPESQVRSGLAAGGNWIRTIGPAFSKRRSSADGGTGSSRTLRWREMDSNLQYRAGSRLPLTGETLLPRPPGERQDRVAACEIFFAV